MNSRRGVCLLFVLIVSCSADLLAQTPVPGQNINMVSGITLPTGDPFLQRQNEPSMAVSTRNPLHLLAGANDYRTVNLNTDSTPGQAVASPDAWVGIFKSFDGGATWISTLLPGYPGDTSPAGFASPLIGLTTGSDATVRSAPAGLFYLSNIAFNRNTNLGVVAVSRFMDLNIESGDRIPGINTVVVDSGTSGQFLDKPWLAVGLPGTATCTIAVPQGTNTVLQTVPAAPVYLLWSRFTGATSTKIMFSRSLDCGATWSNPTKLSESNSVNQGTTIAVAPNGSNIYVAWRRFGTSSQPDAIVVATSSDGGKTFGKSVDVITLPPFSSANPNVASFFDQPSTSSSFRTNAFPTLAVDSGRVYVAWAQRWLGTNGQARIAMSTLPIGGTTWSAPFLVDSGALDDRGINVVTASVPSTTLTNGHQFMPQLTFAGGLLTLAYYDQRQDHTVDLFKPHDPWAPDANGFFYDEAVAVQDCVSAFSSATLCDPLSSVFTPFMSDAGLTRRHTVDIVVAQATPAATPVFATARVSQYKVGLANDGTDVDGEIKQLQFNPPNLPLFAVGTTPFIGDYIDVASLGFVFVPTGPKPGWTFNTAAQPSPTQYITWTDNRDVRAPVDGDWTKFTPPGAGCDAGHVADRNQNIYVSRVSQGLVLSSPQNTKPLSTTLQRAFTVAVQNFTNFDRVFRLSIANQPPGAPASGWASFTAGTNNPLSPPSPLTTTLDVAVGAHSGVSRMVFAASTSSFPTITVNGTEITGLGGTVKSGGLTGFVALNPDPSAAAVSSLFGNVETYDPSITNAVFDSTLPTAGLNGSLTNGSLTNGSLTNTELSNGSLTNGSLTNGSLTNGSLTNGSLTNGSLTNGSLTNGSLTNGSLTNGSLTNGSLTNTTISDATYTLTNNGGTTASYTVSLVGTLTTTTTQFLQLIASKTYYTPFALDCSGVLQQPQSIILANVNVPVVQPLTNGSLTNTGITNGSLTNMTLAVAPGDSVQITIRGLGLTTTDLQQVTQQLAPVVTAQAANTNDTTNTPKFAAPLFITTAASSVPNGSVNTAYSAATVQVIGGTAPYTWSVATGALPPGLTLNATTGAISGTPSAAGTFNFTIQVADSSTPQSTAQAAFSITIAKASTTTTITSAAGSSLVGQPITVSWSVTVNPPAGSGPATPSGTVTVADGNGASCSGAAPSGSCVLTPTAAGTTLTATYPGDSNFTGSSGTQSHTVAFYTFAGFLSPLSTAGTLSAPSFSGSQTLGSAVPLKWQLKDLSGNFITSLSTTTSIKSVLTGATCPVAPVPAAGATFLLYSPTAGATGGSTFRYDTTNNVFIFNWDSSTAVPTGPGCYAVLLKLNDSSPEKVTEVQLK